MWMCNAPRSRGSNANIKGWGSDGLFDCHTASDARVLGLVKGIVEDNELLKGVSV